MEAGEFLFETMLQYADVCNSRENITDNDQLQRLRIVADLQDKQQNDLLELRNCIEFINQHTRVIQSALQEAKSEEAVVPLCDTIVKDILSVKTNIQESISNAGQIKKMLGVSCQPAMDNLLRKMELQLNNWSAALSIASRNLVNSRALIDNIQNLIVAQQQMCTEVENSGLFACLDSSQVHTPQGAPQAHSDTAGSQPFDVSGKCSTPLSFKDNSSI